MRSFIFLLLTMSLSSWAVLPHEQFPEETFTQREIDTQGHLLKETFPNKKSIEISFDELNRITKMSLGDLGDISYSYENGDFSKITRTSATGEVLYVHTYEYNANGQLISESLISDLGKIIYNRDFQNRIFSTESPYSLEVCKYDPSWNIVEHFLNGITNHYSYTRLNELIWSRPSAECYIKHDEDGNLVRKGSPRGRALYRYDDFGRLAKVISTDSVVSFSYDKFDRRLSKTVDQNGREESETYLYFGGNEIAIFGEDGELKQLRVPGRSFHDEFIKAVAIETESGIYAPIHDIQGNIRKLINIQTKEVIDIASIDPFGPTVPNTHFPTPWIFAAKHYDQETHLVYFGSRYYDPELKEWISPDPMGTIQSLNPYIYCLNNPLAYFDPDGEYAFALSLVNLAWGTGAVFTFPAWGTAAVAGAATGAICWAAYEGISAANKWKDNHTNSRKYDDIRIKKGKEGIQKDGTPGPNTDQNKQAKDARREIERKLGRKLTEKERRKFHDHVTRQNYDFHELVEEGEHLFDE